VALCLIGDLGLARLASGSAAGSCGAGCDGVMSSHWSRVVGVPVVLFAFLAHSLMGAALFGLARFRQAAWMVVVSR
jgi:uncharacterized membrane protein